MALALETIALSKEFTLTQGYRDILPWRKRKRVVALREVSLQVPQGEVFGILGPNGAGKTTLFKILGALILPGGGQALVKGMDVVRHPDGVRQVLTYVINEERSLLWRLTGMQNLLYFAALNDIPRKEARQRIDLLLSLLDLTQAANQRVMSYSSGMKQKLALARGLLTDPEILLLDEPARSIDPLMTRSLWQFIKEELVHRQGKTVLLATHNLEEARRVCHRLAVLHRGQVRACGSVEELIGAVEGNYRYTLTLDPSSNGVLSALGEIRGVKDVRVVPAENGGPWSLDVTLEDPVVQVPLLLEKVLAAKGKVLACAPREESLRDVLETLTGERA